MIESMNAAVNTIRFSILGFMASMSALGGCGERTYSANLKPGASLICGEDCTNGAVAGFSVGSVVGTGDADQQRATGELLYYYEMVSKGIIDA